MNIPEESTMEQTRAAVIPPSDNLKELQLRGSQEPPNGQHGDPAAREKKAQLAETFRDWLQSKEEAQNQNRNLIQYGAGLAAALGVGAGSGGIFAVSKALAAAAAETDNVVPRLSEWLLSGLIYAASVASAILLVLVVITYVLRQRAEKRTSHYKGLLITQEPDTFFSYFMPAKEE
jgi:hypothetical protein